MNFHPDRVRAITLDLDDTLWPVAPTILHAEASLSAWLDAHAPRVGRRFDRHGMRAVRDAVTRDRPDWAHDLSAQRLEAIRRLLAASGEDEALAVTAFEVFLAARQQVELFADVLPALQRLAARWPLLALSNGNADVQRTGVGAWFAGAVSAREVGHAKPNARIFHAACERLARAPDEVLHVGDDLRLDVLAAAAAGLQCAWIRRGDEACAAPAVPGWQGRNLLQLADRLGA